MTVGSGLFDIPPFGFGAINPKSPAALHIKMPHWTGCGRNTRDDDARLRDGHGRRIGPSCVGAQAAAEGLELVRAPTSASGYKGVSYAPHSKNIQVIAYFKGKMVTIAKAGRLPDATGGCPGVCTVAEKDAGGRSVPARPRHAAASSRASRASAACQARRPRALNKP